MSNKIKCTCGHSWDKSSSSKKDMRICHLCGKDNTMKNGGWLDAYDDVPQAQVGTMLAPITGDDVAKFFDMFSVPQKAVTKMVTGKYQTPSEAMNIKNPVGAFATDMILDPVTLIGGAGAASKISKASKVVTKTPQQALHDAILSKVKKENPSFFIKPSPKTAKTNKLEKEVADKYLKSFVSNPDERLVYETANPRIVAKVPLSSSIGLNPHLEGGRKAMKTSKGSGLFLQPADEFEKGYNIYDLLSQTQYHLRKNKNGGWLEKYEQGGMVLKQKTKDNYGKQENANEGYSTAGPGWIGEGTTNRGFNYNGAWGGTMQMGGAMPGAVGFTYARTGSIPSNGPYAKKTKASAQNGQEMKFYQEGLDFKPKNISKNGGWLDKFEDDVPKAQWGTNTGDIASLPGVRKEIPFSKEQLAKNKKEVEERTKAENAKTIADRKTRIKASEEAKKKPFSAKTLAEQTQATGDKFRLFPNDPNSFIDDYLNPGVMLGGMASGLGSVPYDVQQGNYGQAAVSVVSPLVVGAFGGIGANNAKQFVNNLVNPLAGISSKPLSISSSVDDVGKGLTQVPQAPKPTWQMQELPGLHLKSTMEGQAISKIVEPKTGLINTEQALAIIGKESGGPEKVAMIKQGLGENLPKKMDFNEFRKVTQDQLIPLERQFSIAKSDYGLQRLNYGRGLYNTLDDVEAGIKEANEMLEFVKKQRYSPTASKNAAIKNWKSKIVELNEMKSKGLIPLENQTLILGNKSKFGRGSNAHGNPDETLGHAHFLRDAETPDVLTVTQIQSDAFQGTHRSSMKTKDQVQFSYDRQLEHYAKNKEKLEGITKLPDGTYQFADGQKISKGAYDNMFSGHKENLALSKADLENFTQKQLLDKNHQERYLQELVDYAGKRGDVNKVRVPTSETAAKVQGYEALDMESIGPKSRARLDKSNSVEEFLELTIKEENLDRSLSTSYRNQFVKLYNDYKSGSFIKPMYSPEHETILKKYSEQPKTIKKLFGQEPKIVTDSKGNTWYEFDISDKAKKGKMEIKAFSTAGAIGTTGALSQMQDEETIPEMKQGGIIKDDRGQWAHPGEITEISSPYITMEGVPYPVLGISDTGDTKLMKPGKDYKFKGKKVTEYPVKKWLEKYN